VVEKMNIENNLKQLRKAVFSGEKNDVIQVTEETLKTATDPKIVAKEIEYGIKTVGDSFEKSEIYLPDLIRAGDAARSGMSLVNAEIIKRGETASVRGKVLIGTVDGDIHNIGKDIVAALLVAAGFEVHDLGVRVPASRFFSEAEALEVDVIGMSALLETLLLAALSKAVPDEEAQRGITQPVSVEDLPEKLGGPLLEYKEIKPMNLLINFLRSLKK
jgi:methanogenic corrinoid protein MtbC1